MNKIIKNNNNNLPKGWRKVKLGEIVENFDSKRIPLSSIQRAKMKGEYPYYGAAGIIDYINDYIFDGLYLLIAEDGTLTSNGDKPMLQLVKGKFWVNNHAHVIKGKDDLETMFLFYALSTISITPYITGAVQPKLTQENLNNIEILYPEDKKIRKEIVLILSAFDDKIEVNNKIIKTLEEMAQEIFKEWFVRFRFSGWQKVKFVDSELGKIPEGWEVRAIENVTEVVSRGPSLIYVRNRKDGVPVLNQRCIRNGEIELEAIQYAKPVKEIFYLRKWDILINSMGTGTLGRVSRNLSINYPMIIHNCITFIRSNSQKIQIYLYYQIKNYEKYFEQIAIGSTGQTSLTVETIKGLKILFPSDQYLEQFFERIQSIWEKIGLLKKENQTLAELRDLLLPKLMSGEIRV
jgi:type I restriction enzyme S subunit